MYRIRLVSGQEKTYPSIQDLTAGVQRGEVTAEAEIYHQRSDRWLSIESHPHYRMAADGGTATRTSRLRFTRPSTPASTPAVLPTPTAQKPEKNDLEELNRLLVLLDPLPTPAQRAEPETPAVKSPPELSLVRPDPAPEPPSVSDDKEPTFGTMLRLEDLELLPETVEEEEAEAAVESPEAMSEEPEVGETPVLEPVEAVAETVDTTDLGLPVEIELDEIPVRGEAVIEEPSEELEEVVAEAEEPVPVLEPVAVAANVAADSFADVFAPAPQLDEPRAPLDAVRRFRPMLYVAAIALIAAAVFAFTGGGEDPNQGMVTLASATAPSAGATPAPVTVPPTTNPSSAQPASTKPASASPTVGFPLPDTARIAKSVPESAPSLPASPLQDGGQDNGLLPTAPDLDLAAGTTSRVESRTSAAVTGGGAALARGYVNAYAELGRDFTTQMDRNGLVRLFSQTQLTTSDGLAGARRALDASGGTIRQYHTREAAIEKAYQDSARALDRSGASPADMRDWMTHISLKESSEAVGESTRLLGQVDAVFALLQAQSGRYKIQGSAIHFDNADAAARYSELQGWITRRLEHWSGQPASAVPITVQPILEGIGLTRLPVSQ